MLSPNGLRIFQLFCGYRCSGQLALKSIRHTSSSDGAVVYESRLQIPLSKQNDHHQATISVLHMNDSSVKNALSKASVFGMLEILEQLQNVFLKQDSEDPKIRALIVKSNIQGVFCAGANLKERQAMNRNQVEAWLRVQRALMDNLNDFPYPTIAAIDGHALGGGLELALACDLRIINEKAKVGLVETSLAIIPGAGGTQRLARLIGVGRAKEHIFVAEAIDGKEAHRLGIANHLTSGPDSAYNKALDIAAKICKRGPKALKLAKAAINNGSQASLDTGLDIEHAYYGQLLDSSDRAEGMQAFVEKREPFYTGD